MQSLSNLLLRFRKWNQKRKLMKKLNKIREMDPFIYD